MATISDRIQEIATEASIATVVGTKPGKDSMHRVMRSLGSPKPIVDSVTFISLFE